MTSPKPKRTVLDERQIDFDAPSLRESPTALSVAKAPCKSCPYRCDVPSGVWAPEEYAKLPGYDGEIVDQALKGAVGVFLCHQRDGNLCAGWLAGHGPDNLLALRLSGGRVAPGVWSYETATPVFPSGAKAAAHGLAGVRNPPAAARRMMSRLLPKVSQPRSVRGRNDGA